VINAIQGFNNDAFTGRPKILFIGLGESSHTHAWLDLLAGKEFNIRLFAMPTVLLPDKLQFRAYVTTPNLKRGLDPSTRLCLFPTPEELDQLSYTPQFLLFRMIRKVLFAYGRLIHYPFMHEEGDILAPSSVGAAHLPADDPQFEPSKSIDANLGIPQMRAASPEEWLAQIIPEWRPDIIHTLGVYDHQGGEFFFSVRRNYKLEGIGKWVLQLRGGSDIALRRHNPETAKNIQEIFNACDEILTDNYANIEYITQLGLRHKIAAISPVPGSGGLDTDIELGEFILPSRKERVILWPKAYEAMWSKALPVMEALKLAWDRIKPCRVYMTVSTPETEAWFWTLPEEMREVCSVLPRIPRDELLELMKKARILLAPSLVDGVPNILYEAMARGAFPIVSPLDTITPVVKSEVNVLFARNLYPDEISEALITAMNDDALVDRAAGNNLELVKNIASRQVIAKNVADYYERLAFAS
jgi:glycosyltransferase involved in cell wall biosynthesis